MHFRVEVIMPPTDDVEKQLEVIMAPFSENSEDPNCDYIPKWWDWYVIGGRWRGEKAKEKLDNDTLKKFYDVLKMRGNEMVQSEIDAVYRKHFPDQGETCPFVRKDWHEQYDTTLTDVWKLEDVNQAGTANKLIIAGPEHDENITTLELFQHDIWNGVNFEITAWDCTIGGALRKYVEKIDRYKEEYREKITPQPNWLVITVDCHN